MVTDISIVMTGEEIFDEYKNRIIIPLMESDCVLTSLLYEGSVENH